MKMRIMMLALLAITSFNMQAASGKEYYKQGLSLIESNPIKAIAAFEKAFALGYKTDEVAGSLNLLYLNEMSNAEVRQDMTAYYEYMRKRLNILKWEKAKDGKAPQHRDDAIKLYEEELSEMELPLR